jgi:hypothetical protein
MSNKALTERFLNRHGKRSKISTRTKRKAPVHSQGFSAMRRGLLLGTGASVVALAGFGVMVHNDRPQTAQRVPQKLRVVLIDSSDKNTAVQDRLISRIVEQDAINDLNEGDRLILLGLSADQYEPLEERFNQVSPPRANDASPWTANLEQLEATWRNEFLDTYIEDTRDLRQIVEKRQTPFLEGMMQISSILQQYEAEEKSVIIISDALQHISGGLSAYTQTPSRSVLNMPENLTGFYSPEFSGASIQLVHIKRNQTQRLQGAEHRAWIDQVLLQYGADLKYVPLA